MFTVMNVSTCVCSYHSFAVIEDDPVRPVYIMTEPGVGYRFNSEIS